MFSLCNGVTNGCRCLGIPTDPPLAPSSMYVSEIRVKMIDTLKSDKMVIKQTMPLILVVPSGSYLTSLGLYKMCIINYIAQCRNTIKWVNIYKAITQYLTCGKRWNRAALC